MTRTLKELLDYWKRRKQEKKKLVLKEV